MSVASAVEKPAILTPQQLSTRKDENIITLAAASVGKVNTVGAGIPAEQHHAVEKNCAPQSPLARGREN